MWQHCREWEITAVWYLDHQSAVIKWFCCYSSWICLWAAFFQKNSFLCWFFFLFQETLCHFIRDNKHLCILWLYHIHSVNINNWVYWLSEFFRNNLLLKKKTSIVFMKFTDIYAWVPKLHLSDSGLNIIIFLCQLLIE